MMGSDKLKKTRSLLIKYSLIIAVMCFAVLYGKTNVSAASIVESGTCGDNLTWTLDNTGLLEISGTGSIKYEGGWSSSVVYKANRVIINYGITSIDDHAFWYFWDFYSIDIPDSVTSIGDSAFGDHHNLTSIIIPNSITSIGNHAFAGCRSLTSITIPDSVTSIGERAFAECDSLKSITVPDSVTSISDSTFYGCDSLRSITIPDSVNFIGKEVFFDCNKLKLISTYSGSFTETWAKNNGYCIKLVDTGEEIHDLETTSHYSWSEDYTQCTAFRSCNKDNSHYVKETVTASVVIIETSCTSQGPRQIKYTATFKNNAYETQSKTVYQYFTEHDFGSATYTWSDDYKKCTATRVCKNNSEHIEKETVNTKSITDAESTLYIAIFTNSTFEPQFKTVANIKKKQPMIVKAKTATVKYDKLKKKNQTVTAKKAYTVSKAQGKVTYKKSSGNSKITVASSGKITIKKGLKKGTYKIKVKVKAAGNSLYQSGSKTVTVTIKVKA